jgi:hypothetical protein
MWPFRKIRLISSNQARQLGKVVAPLLGWDEHRQASSNFRLFVDSFLTRRERKQLFFHMLSYNTDFVLEQLGKVLYCKAQKDKLIESLCNTCLEG